jgi:pimeloyl-ACP methyl ester carboxylesterase
MFQSWVSVGSCLMFVLLLFTWGISVAGPGESLPAGLRSGTLDVEGGSLYYEVAGEGDSLVLLHDGMLHLEGYDGQFSPFAEHLTVARYDRRGYGRSSVPDLPFSDLEDLLRIFDKLKIRQAMLLGTSAGSRLAVDFTLAHPDRVKALVLVGAVVSGLGFSEHFFTRGGHLTPADRADAASMGRFYTLRDPYQFGPENAAARKRAWTLLEANLQNFDFTKNRLAEPPSRPGVGNLGEIEVPTLIVVGEYDIADVHAHCGALEAGITGARRIVIPGAGHLVPFEEPEEFNEVVLSFLKATDFFAALQAGDAAGAATVARRLRRTDPEFVPASEAELNLTGYRFLQERKPDQAVEIFKLNAEFHPESWNAWDSLGEGQAAAGDIEGAITSYRRSLELNPDNDNGKDAIEQLEERRQLEAG